MLEKSNHKSSHNVRAFFLLTFIYSWVIWLPLVLSEMGILKTSDKIAVIEIMVFYLGAFGPLFAAVTIIAYKDGWPKVKRYLCQALDFRIKARYFLMAIVIPLIVTAGTHYIVNLTGIDKLPHTFFPENLPVPMAVMAIPYFIAMLLIGGGQEEFGWRGYAQEPLQNRFGVLGGSILLGVVWGLWHLPMWFMGDQHAYYSFFAFWLQIISLSVIIGWIYNASGKKLSMAWIVHGISNTVVPFFPVMHMDKVPQPGYWIWVGFYSLAAIIMTLWFSTRNKYGWEEKAAPKNTQHYSL